jgi:predicted cupin superfamily sugar epimerase
MTADEIILLLDLAPHPEGGYYRETFRDPSTDMNRDHSTAIYYLLRAGERSHWHRVDAAEVWHWYAGDALQLELSDGAGPAETHTLGPDLDAGERPQFVVPAGVWQAAESIGEWTLVGCTVAPGFRFSGFEMAPPGWQPGK